MLTSNNLQQGCPTKFLSGMQGFLAPRVRSGGPMLLAQTNEFTGSSPLTGYASIPSGGQVAQAFVPAIHAGAIACRAIFGRGITAANLDGISSLSTSITGSATVTGHGFMTCERTVAMGGSCTVTAAPKGFGNIVVSIDVSARPSAFDIAQAVLNATAAMYNAGGTIGNKINSAASAGDPWTTPIPGSYPAGSAGQLLGNLGEGSDPNTIAAAVWNKATTDHTATGTFGAFVQSKLLTVAKFLGLK